MQSKTILRLAGEGPKAVVGLREDPNDWSWTIEAHTSNRDGQLGSVVTTQFVSNYHFQAAIIKVITAYSKRKNPLVLHVTFEHNNTKEVLLPCLKQLFSIARLARRP